MHKMPPTNDCLSMFDNGPITLVQRSPWPELRLLGASRQLQALTGHTETEVGEIGAWLDLIHPEDREIVSATLRNNMDSQEHRIACRYRLKHRNGTWTMVEDYIMGQAQAEVIMGYLLDLTSTARPPAEPPPQWSEDNPLLQGALSRLRHEIRTPLNSLCTLSDLLASRQLDPDEEKACAKMIGSASRTLSIQFDILTGLISPGVEIQHINPALYAPTEQKKGGSTRQAPPRILVVEDAPSNQKVIALVLKQMGHRFDLVSNGLEAVHTIQNEHSYELVLMDCQMPVMDGLEATRQIRAFEKSNKKPPIPVIALTADAFESAKVRCLDAGMNEFLTKPIDLAILRDTIDRWTDIPEPAAA